MDKKVMKKLNPILKEANTFKSEKNFEDAVRKFREAISFIRLNIKDYDEREVEVENVLAEIDNTYSVQISDITSNAKGIVKEKQFNKGFTLYDDALNVSNKIKNVKLKDSETETINLGIKEAKLLESIEQGKNLKENKKYDNAISIFQNTLNKANEIYESEPEHIEIKKIRGLINETYLEKIQGMMMQGNTLKEDNKIDDALNIYEEAKSICANLFDQTQRNEAEEEIKRRINQIFSDQINPIIENGKSLLERNDFDKAIGELKKAEEIVLKMYDSDQKVNFLKELGNLLNPIYHERIIPIKEKGLKLIEEENYAEKIKIVNEAATVLNQALDLANKMINSEEKSKIIKEISELVDSTCSAGINVRKVRGERLIEDKEYEKAVGEMYSALSIAKNMACAEEDNKEIEDLKFIVNQIYSTQIGEILEDGKKLLNQNENEKAFERFNEALSISNKMYVSEEMDDEIRKINELLKEAEIKKLVSEGSLMVQQKQFSKELEELQAALRNADKITHLERKKQKIREIKELIDNLHSKEIKFLQEQGTLMADQGKFNEAYAEFENALKIAETIDKKDLREKEKESIIRLYVDKLNMEAEENFLNQKYDESISTCQHAIDLDQDIAKSYYNMANTYLGKNEYEKAIELYQKTVELSPESVKAWNNMGLAYELNEDYTNALDSCNKAVEIDNNFSLGFYRIGNIYNHMGEKEKAIGNYKTATKLNPDLAKAWLFLGGLYHEKNEFFDAVGCIKKALELNNGFKGEVGSLIEKFDNLIELMSEKLTEMFKNKKDAI
jgi:tetratricopeptide (TPR) repeat protein